MGETTEIWAQRRTEADAAYDAFRRYLDKGPDRSFAAVGDELQMSPTQLKKWAKAHDWEGRVRAWNRAQDREVKRRHREALRALADSHRGVGRALVGKGLQALQKINPEILRPGEAVAMLRLGTELQRNSYSYATEDLEHVHAVAEAVSKQFDIEPDAVDDLVESFEDMLKR